MNVRVEMVCVSADGREQRQDRAGNRATGVDDGNARHEPGRE